jgi:hypothetical protein
MIFLIKAAVGSGKEDADEILDNFQIKFRI